MGTGLAEHPDARCGNCAFRVLRRHHDRTYPKCEVGHRSFSAATDVRAWWPGCVMHEWGDPKLSSDAARSGPPD